MCQIGRYKLRLEVSAIQPTEIMIDTIRVVDSVEGHEFLPFQGQKRFMKLGAGASTQSFLLSTESGKAVPPRLIRLEISTFKHTPQPMLQFIFHIDRYTTADSAVRRFDPGSAKAYELDSSTRWLENDTDDDGLLEHRITEMLQSIPRQRRIEFLRECIDPPAKPRGEVAPTNDVEPLQEEEKPETETPGTPEGYEEIERPSTEDPTV